MTLSTSRSSRGGTSSMISPRSYPSSQIANTPSHIVQIINDQEVHNYKLGVILIIVSITTWIIGLELVNVVLKSDGYSKPFFISVVVGSCFSLNFIPDIFRWFFPSCQKSDDVSSTSDVSENVHLLLPKSSDKSLEKLLQQNNQLYQPQELSKHEVIVLAIQISVIYYFYNLCILQALRFTSASNQTVIGTTSSIFTLFIGVFLKFDRFSIKKICCVLGSLSGVFLVNYSESQREGNGKSKFEPKDPFLGNCIALIGAFMYALYLVVMKINCGMGKKTTNERQLFGYVGIITMFLGIPILFVVDKLNIEKFEFPPPDNTILIAILINGVFSVLSDYTAILSMLLTSPLVTSLSLTTGIPITIFIDYMIILFTTHQPQSLNYSYFLGIACMLVSVILININITTENELIGNVIEEVLEEAIRQDEVLSPILSPLLEPSSNYAASPFVRAHLQSQLPFDFGIKYPFSPFITPKMKSKPNLHRDISGFNLNADDLSHNLNHSSLYTISRAEDRGLEGSLELEPSRTNLMIYSGANHKYHVKMVELDEETDDMTDDDQPRMFI